MMGWRCHGILEREIIVAKNKLPKPACELGYTEDQIEEILGDRIKAFNKWMYGQTQALCDGRSYNYEKKEYAPTGCGPHGATVYSWDLQDFLAGRPVTD